MSVEPRFGSPGDIADDLRVFMFVPTRENDTIQGGPPYFRAVLDLTVEVSEIAATLGFQAGGIESLGATAPLLEQAYVQSTPILIEGIEVRCIHAADTLSFCKFPWRTQLTFEQNALREVLKLDQRLVTSGLPFRSAPYRF